MELLIALKITAIAALVLIMILGIYAMVALKNLSGFIRQAHGFINSFKKESTKSFEQIRGDISEIKSGALQNKASFEKLAGALYENTNDISELKEKMVESLGKVDKVTDSVKLNVSDFGEIKLKAGATLDNFDSLAGQLKNSARNLEQHALHILDAVKPFTSAINFVKDNLKNPAQKTGNYISAATKALSVFKEFLSGQNGAPAEKPIKETRPQENVESEDMELKREDVEGQIHGPYVTDQFTEFGEKAEKATQESRASDIFNVVGATPGDIDKYDMEGVELLESTYNAAKDLLSQAEEEIEKDDGMPPEEKRKLRREIKRLREKTSKSAESLRKKLEKKGIK